MGYSFTRNGNNINIEFFDAIDLSSTNLIKSEFEEIFSKDYAHVVLSAKKLKYIDSSGVATLLMIKRRCGQFGCEFTISDISEAGYRVIELAKLNNLLPISNIISEGKEASKDPFEFSESIFNEQKTVDKNIPKSQNPTENSLDSPEFKPGSFL